MQKTKSDFKDFETENKRLKIELESERSLTQSLKNF